MFYFSILKSRYQTRSEPYFLSLYVSLLFTPLWNVEKLIILNAKIKLTKRLICNCRITKQFYRRHINCSVVINEHTVNASKRFNLPRTFLSCFHDAYSVIVSLDAYNTMNWPVLRYSHLLLFIDFTIDLWCAPLVCTL